MRTGEIQEGKYIRSSAWHSFFYKKQISRLGFFSLQKGSPRKDVTEAYKINGMKRVKRN